MAAGIDDLIGELTLAYHRLTQASDRLHARSGLSTGMRSVLLVLEEAGPQTISGLAEKRSVSRQFMQRLVQEMAALGWLTIAPDAEDKRVSVVAPTPRARRALAQLHRAEAPLLAELETHFSASELTTATAVLRRLNGLMKPEGASE